MNFLTKLLKYDDLKSIDKLATALSSVNEV